MSKVVGSDALLANIEETKEYVNGKIGELESLETEDKTDIVGAINELNEKVSSEPSSGGDDSRIQSEISKIGVRLDDGLMVPYITVDTASIIPAFSTASWGDIKGVADAYYAGDFTLEDIQSVWKAGNTRTMDIAAMTTGPETHAAQTVTLFIADFNHDTLTTAQGDKTKALMTLGFVLAEDGAIGSYPYSSNARKAWGTGVCYNALGSEVQALVKPVNKTDFGSLTVFLPTYAEMTGYVLGTSDYDELVLDRGTWSIRAINNAGGTKYANTGSRSKNVFTITSDSVQYMSGSGSIKYQYVCVKPNNGAIRKNTDETVGLMPLFCI